MKRAIILFSGGLDSTTCLVYAKSQGFEPYALSFDYGQRHEAELLAAARIANKYATEHKIFPLAMHELGGSALTDHSIAVPTKALQADIIPVTYVPARNTIFLSIALGWAEVVGAKDIFIGVSAIDYSNYPDCRPEFIAAFQHLANLATKMGVEAGGVTLHTPLINLSKAETIRMGVQLGVDYGLTVSCYQATRDGLACGECDSCLLRMKGFKEASVQDPTRYVV